MLHIYVVGCGGIGGYLLDKLPMCIASLSLDCETAESRANHLANAGMLALGSVVDDITLIDGDSFEPRNALRQEEGGGSKLIQRMRKMKDSIVMSSYLRNVELIGYNDYLTPDNIEEIIPKLPKPNKHNNVENVSLKSRLTNSASVVFLCVDNLKTRYEVSKYCEGLRDVIVFNGGNDKTKGHVTVYERAEGIELDPPIYTVYPEIRPDADLRPDETPCTQIAPKHDQIAVTNSMIADVMLARFIQWVQSGLQVCKNDKWIRYNEVLIDIETPSVTPLYHPKKGD